MGKVFVMRNKAVMGRVRLGRGKGIVRASL
jgi:hypothetical protein